MESPYICCPPWNACNSHIQPCCKLIPHAFKTWCNISWPDKRPIPLTACPCAPKKVHNILLSFSFHSFIKSSCIVNRINISNLKVCTHMIAVIIKIICRIFRFCLIQPEYFDPFLIIILFRFAPDIFSCSRIRRVKMDRGTLKIQPYTNSSLRTDQKSFFQHFLIILTGFIHCRPDRYH